MSEAWRVGSKVPINVYEGDRPVCQCHTAIDAKRIVDAVNAAADSHPGTPLSDRVGTLPRWAQDFIHDVETKCDPAGDIRTITELRDTIRALEALAQPPDVNRELLEALEKLLEYLRVFWPLQPLFSTYDDRQALEIADAEAAIRKAKGE